MLSAAPSHRTIVCGLKMLDFSPWCVLPVVCVLSIWWLTQRARGMPPGPTLVPILGNLLSLTRDPRVMFRKLRRQYGDVFSIYVFNKPIIVLNGYDCIRDALVSHADVFSDRPHSFLSDYLLKGKGIVGTSGSMWREHRTFAVKFLKQLNTRPRTVEDIISTELSCFLQVLESRCDQEFDCKDVVLPALSNIISSIVLGKRFSYNDHVFRSVLDRMEENVANFGAASILNVAPLIRFIPGDYFKFERILANLDFTEREFVQPAIREHLEKTEEETTDFISEYLSEMRNRQQDGDTSMDMSNLQACILDIFGSGTETAASTIRWALALFLNYPDIQETCFQEIRHNIGLRRSVVLKDKSCLPYLEATMCEISRFANIVPAGVPHSVSRTTTFRGFTIPKGVMVLPVLDSILHDPDLWGDPEHFRPERFIDAEGEFIRKAEFVPFSLGRRVCLGETLAKAEMFLFLASMIQRFKFERVNATPPSLEAALGIVLSPSPFLMKVFSRQDVT